MTAEVFQSYTLSGGRPTDKQLCFKRLAHLREILLRARPAEQDSTNDVLSLAGPDRWRVTMNIHISTVLLSIVAAMGLSSAASSVGAAPTSDQPALERIQYNRYPDQRPDGYYPEPRSYSGQRPDGYYPDPRDRYADRDYPKWRPGDVLPGQLLDYVVDDWEPRGLERPPGGHLWVRVGQQFILVRERDRMISRVINFD